MSNKNRELKSIKENNNTQLWNEVTTRYMTSDKDVNNKIMKLQTETEFKLKSYRK